MIVVKVGGSLGIDYDALCEDVAALHNAGEKLVVVHGGSAETNRIAEHLGHPPKFVTSPSGYSSRFTDRKTLEFSRWSTAASRTKGWSSGFSVWG